MTNVKSKHKLFVEHIEEKFGKETYSIIDTYQTLDIKLRVRHNFCNYEWLIKPSNLKNSKKPPCPNCSKKKTFTTDEYAQKIIKDSNSKAKLVGEYKNAYTKVEIFYLECGHSHSSRAELVKLSCPICATDRKMSRGEKHIRDFLNKEKILYKVQHSFENCVYVNKLLFDFALFNSNNELIFLVEFDGIQHFKSIEWFGGEKNFKSQQEKDQIKNEYCKEHNIKLIRIPYWEEENIETILANELLKGNFTTNPSDSDKTSTKMPKEIKVKTADLSKYEKLDSEYLLYYYPEVFEVINNNLL